MEAKGPEGDASIPRQHTQLDCNKTQKGVNYVLHVYYKKHPQTINLYRNI